MTDYALAVLSYFMLMVGAAIIGMWLQKKIDRLSALKPEYRGHVPPRPLPERPNQDKPYVEHLSFEEAFKRYPSMTACGNGDEHAWRDENGKIQVRKNWGQTLELTGQVPRPLTGG